MMVEPANTRIARTLLVEDNPGDVLLLREALSVDEQRPVSIEHAATLSAAIVLLEKQKFDIILLDLGLPDSLGIGTLEFILSHAATTPVIILTGLDDLLLAKRCLALGAQDYIVKGLRTSLNGWMIHNTIARYAAQLELAQERDNLKLSLEKIAHLNQILRTNRNIDELIVKEKDPQTLIRQACELLVEVPGCTGGVDYQRA